MLPRPHTAGAQTPMFLGSDSGIVSTRVYQSITISAGEHLTNYAANTLESNRLIRAFAE
jgi:hypothetical protein